MSTSVAPAIRVLGRTGLPAFEIGVGGWALGGLDWNLGLPMGWGGIDEDAAREAVTAALDGGANLIDTADVYGHGKSERVIGAAIRGRTRSSLVLATKTGYFRGCAPHPFHPLHMRHQLEMSLSNLGTDYLDIYFFHNLEFGAGDALLDDAIDAMRRFQDEGKIRFIGLRGPHKHALNRYRTDSPDDDYAKFTTAASRVLPDVLQVRYNMLTSDPGNGRDVFAWAAARQIPLLINKPLAQGLLLDKYDPDHPPAFSPGDHRERKAWFRPPALRVLRARLARIKERFGGTTADLVRVALQYCLARSPHCVVLAGAKNPQQAAMNVAAAGQPLSSDDLQFIRGVMAGIREEIGEYFSREGTYVEADLTD